MEKSKSKKIIIFGATGNVGKQLSIALSEHNYDLVLISGNYDKLKILQGLIKSR